MQISPNTVSYEYIRTSLAKVNKFHRRVSEAGLRVAQQEYRPLKRMHTYYAGQRTEIDYTKYAVWLFPNEKSTEPVLFFTGFGVDHYSTVVKGYTLTPAPSARDAIRLYRNCVLPKSLWLPDNLKHYTHNWDVFGLEEIVAVDNAMDLISNAAILVFIHFGTIVLRMPPARGDYKGTCERTNKTFETQLISTLPGYVPCPRKGYLSDEYKHLLEKAKIKAKYTVAEYEGSLVPHILEFNSQRHPRLNAPRQVVWRRSQGNSPILIPTGIKQIRAVFSLTYSATLTREGVQVEGVKFNSPELYSKFLTYSGTVYVKLDPDDIRSVLVAIPNVDTLIEAMLTTIELPFKMSLELFRFVMNRNKTNNGMDQASPALEFAFSTQINDLQSGGQRMPGETELRHAQASYHAASISLAAQDTSRPSAVTSAVEKLLNETRLGEK